MKKCTASVLVMSYNARNTGKNLDTKESTHTHTHILAFPEPAGSAPAPLFTATQRGGAAGKRPGQR